MLDFDTDVPYQGFLRKAGVSYQLRHSVCGSGRATLLFTRLHEVPITVFHLGSSWLGKPINQRVTDVLRFFERSLDSFRPDVLLTIDSDSISLGMVALAKRRDIPVVFVVHNFSYRSLSPFWRIDYCTVPSEFARRFYWDNVGLACHTLPNPVAWERVLANDRDPRLVTFVNPSLEKGVYPFARIADELGRLRPDIRFLVVESRGTKDTLAACGLDPNAHGNIQFMANTSDPRRFWSITKILLMPSLWWETQGLVAIEAMINGIPVIGSDRGGIPETLGDAGFVLPLPKRLRATSEILPTAAEVKPWVEAIVRLWDDQTLYEEHSAKSRKEAKRWHPDRLRPLYAEFFRNVRPQPGPPFLPRLDTNKRLSGS